MRLTIIAALLALAACTTEPALAPDAPPIILSGDLTRADHQTYKELAFNVPPGTGRIVIDLAYTGKENRAVIDLGLRDPQGQRGWSGGNKSHIEIGTTDATPSYRPGAIQPGTWHVVLGIPNLREGQTAHYDVTIKLSPRDGAKAATMPSAVAKPLSTEPGWRRGDFHMHTAHSDGSCDVNGARGPCPAIHTFEAARDAGLDFAAITDHNTITQLADIRAMQASFPKTLLIPGTEVTTFYGHANAIGVTDFVDFQLGSPRLPTLGKLFDELDAQGAILSINHPGLPSGEVCMGCGWTALNVDYARVTAVEVVNGGSVRNNAAEGLTSGFRFWTGLLDQGRRVTAIGGSDNHDATDRTGAKQPPIGMPTTVVYAKELSTAGIVAGVKSGRVFVDLAGLPGATLDVEGRAGGETAMMGGELRVAAGEQATIAIKAAGLPAGSQLKFVSGNLSASPTGEAGQTVALSPGAAFGWVRAEARDAAGKLLLLGNPIYLRAR